LDVSDPDAVAARVAEAVKVDGKPEALIGSNAYLEPLLEVADEQRRCIIDVNLLGVFYCARDAARAMLTRKCGCSITIGSINSFTPEANVPPYDAAKGGALMLMKSLTRDLGPLGIRVNGIALGGTGASRMLQTNAEAGITLDEPTTDIPFGRRAATDETGRSRCSSPQRSQATSKATCSSPTEDSCAHE
jgi:NAD(P)-dependent dehydrogenase (short-subunit alcohol dehydrogenase family)